MTNEEMLAELRTDSKLSRIWRAVHYHMVMVNMASDKLGGLGPMEVLRMEFQTARAIVEELGKDG